MKNISNRKTVTAAILVAFATLQAPAFAAPKKVSSGKTQVVATIDGREITLNEVRVEMANLALNPADPTSQQTAMASLTDRVLLAEEARRAKLHKQPEALWRMEAAQEKALADMYLGKISQPIEPTQADVEEFILSQPTLFTNAKRYTFDVLELSRDAFDADEMTALFDKSTDFEKLQAHLNEAEIPFTLSRSVRPSSSFPEAIRNQLAQYALGDNIVLQGTTQTSILKIARIMNDSKTLEQSAPIARALLRQEDARKRRDKRQNALRDKAKIVYHNDAVKPATAAND